MVDEPICSRGNSRASLYELRREDTPGLCRYAATVADRSSPVIICHSAFRNTFIWNRELLGAKLGEREAPRAFDPFGGCNSYR
jgi:hypothetical protein